MEMARNPSSDGMTALSEGYPVLKRQPYFVVRKHAWRLESSHVGRGGLIELGIVASGTAGGEMTERTSWAAPSARSLTVRLTSLACW
jgi:hypothetical protein